MEDVLGTGAAALLPPRAALLVASSFRVPTLPFSAFDVGSYFSPSCLFLLPVSLSKTVSCIVLRTSAQGQGSPLFP